MNRIKEVLEEKGIKQTWLAEKLDKSYNMVNGYVQNRQQPRLEVLNEIAEILDADVIEELMNKKNPKEAEKIVKILISRFKAKAGDPKFKALGERFEEIRDKAEQGLISSVEFIKQLCELAKDVLRAEREIISEQEQKSAKSALTDLFLEMRTDQTPAVVERIVNDIDDIVKNVRYDGWQNTITGERLVQKSLRKTLLRYKLHKEEDLFNRAYEYIKEYY